MDMKELINRLDAKAIRADKYAEEAFLRRDYRNYEFHDGRRGAFRDLIIEILDSMDPAQKL